MLLARPARCNPTGIAIVDGTLYGTTAACGGNGGGNVYALDLATGARKTLHSFASGSVPPGEPLVDNGVLFGVTQSAGSDHAGSAYRIDLASGAYALLHTFTAAGNDGDQPSAGLTLRNGVLYGVTALGPGQGINGTIVTINAGTGAEATAGTVAEHRQRAVRAAAVLRQSALRHDGRRPARKQHPAGLGLQVHPLTTRPPRNSCWSGVAGWLKPSVRVAPRTAGSRYDGRASAAAAGRTGARAAAPGW